MSKFLMVLTSCFISAFSFSQNTFPSSGKAGIGTTSPVGDMHVKSSLQYPRYYVQSTHASGKPGYTIADASGNEAWTFHFDTPGGFMGFFRAGFGNHMIITNSGNVGIGTTSPGSFKLAVEGKIGAREIKVTNTTPWPDYVFSRSYNLMPLDLLAKYISNNRHLPGLPSAEEIVKDGGVNLGEMNVKLLEKIEELTLYMLQLKSENNELKKSIEKIEGVIGH